MTVGDGQQPEAFDSPEVLGTALRILSAIAAGPPVKRGPLLCALALQMADIIRQWKPDDMADERAVEIWSARLVDALRYLRAHVYHDSGRGV